MKLYVARHGYAGPAIENNPKAERERPLLAEGKATTLAMAKAMDAMGEAPKFIFSSPFERAVNSADIYGKYFGIQVEVIDDFSPMRPLQPGLENIVGFERMKRVLIVGHVDNTTPCFEKLDDRDKWKDLVMGELRRVEINRKTLEWRLKWSIKPSDLGLKDRDK